MGRAVKFHAEVVHRRKSLVLKCLPTCDENKESLQLWGSLMHCRAGREPSELYIAPIKKFCNYTFLHLHRVVK